MTASPVDPSSDSWDELWRGLVTAALLGTDRRDPPDLPPGPLADVVADAMRPDPATRLLAAVGTVTAARRAAFVALPAAPALQPPDADPRPWCSAAAVDAWRRAVGDWPVLDDEWMLSVVELGLTLPPDVLVEQLQRHRNDAIRRARVVLAGGRTAEWLVELLPSLSDRSGRRTPVEAVTSLPELAMPPELAELLPLDAHSFVTRLAPSFADMRYGPSHRPVLVNLLARCRPEVLVDTATALSQVGSGIAYAMADLCRARTRMLDALRGDI